jgi:prepilin-type N-terminal cleavage/methylation domain-containing protein
MTLLRVDDCTLCGMITTHDRRAFTLVELLVALIIMGVAAAGLASALTGDRRMRDLAAAHAFAADRARERLELLASLPCSAPASGASASAWALERWSATASPSAWSLTDTVTLVRSSAQMVVQARVICPG